MPEYHFIVNGNDMPDDDEPQILANDEAAWHEATLVAGELFKDVDGKFRPGHEWKLEVADGEHRKIYSINVSAKKLA